MASGLLPVNFIVNRKTLCLSEVNPKQVLLPNFFQEDIIPIKFKALIYEQDSPPFMQKLNLTGYGLQISVGLSNNIMADNQTWDVVESGNALEGELNLATANIASALGSATSVQLRFEIILSLADVKYRMSQNILVMASVALAGALIPPPTDTALGNLQAARIYAPLNDCPGMVFRSPDGTKRAFVYYSDEGALQADPIS